MSVRFLARRVYLALAWCCVCPAGRADTSGGALGTALGVDRRTLARWRDWWCEQLPLTALWRRRARASCRRCLKRSFRAN